MITFKEYSALVEEGKTTQELNELFGIFRNNERADKAKAAREKLKKETAEKVAAHRARGKEKPDEEDEEDDLYTQSRKRSASTTGTKGTVSAGAKGRAAERDWVKNA